ncbi:hypothetical protein FA13DRAFT_1708244 [Coprinellus micaceus]|uniref:Uncharacterized protein n=1 Tax=Coprinellus micaceus TaxID=71717 RepID=A0A4Y7TIX0_COPMI|nr:hypothetical protein FA13DRAFT_1708244 [Coprinellus micaceus]
MRGITFSQATVKSGSLIGDAFYNTALTDYASKRRSVVSPFGSTGVAKMFRNALTSKSRHGQPRPPTAHGTRGVYFHGLKILGNSEEVQHGTCCLALATDSTGLGAERALFSYYLQTQTHPEIIPNGRAHSTDQTGCTSSASWHFEWGARGPAVHHAIRRPWLWAGATRGRRS